MGGPAASLDIALEELAESLGAAAVGQQGWQVPLGQLAALTGANAGELICLGPSLLAHSCTGIDPERVKDLTRIGGHDPAINSRVRYGLAAPLMAVLDEADMETQADMRKHRDYGEFLSREDIEFACLTNLVRDSGETVGLTILRGRKAGNISAREKRIFRAASRHFRTAIRLHGALEHRAIELTAASFDGIGKAAFVLDRRGRLRACSALAEGLLAAGDLRNAAGRLGLRDPMDQSLALAVERARLVRSVADAAPATVIAHDSAGLAYTLEISSLPSLHGMPFDAGVLIVARPPREIDAEMARVAAQLYGLTSAEAAVAGLLAAGHAPQAIAERQHVAIGTVRTHIHRILAKAGVRGQVELLAALLSRT